MGKCTVELYFYLIIPLFFSMSAVRADHGPDHDKQHDLAKASQNLVSSLISVPFEFNNNFNAGPEDAYFQGYPSVISIDRTFTVGKQQEGKK